MIRKRSLPHLDGQGDQNNKSRAFQRRETKPTDIGLQGSQLGRIRKLFFGGFIVLIAIVSIGYLLLPFLSTSWTQTWHGEQNDEVNELGHVLHPAEHIYRKPTKITHHWKITSGFQRPDGVLKRAYLINEAFLGPTIQCRSGDKIVVIVENGLDKEGIALHWHGLHMKGANDMDGAVGITQDPIEPGTNFTYEFKVSEQQHGTFWYHAHDGVHRADGIYGAFIVHRPLDSPQAISDSAVYAYDEERLLMIGDWYHRTAEEVFAWYMRAASFGNEPVPDSILVNGIGAYNCSQAVRARPVDCKYRNAPAFSLIRGKAYRLRIVNVGDLAGFTVSITSGRLVPMQVDGGSPIIGHAATSIGVLHPGQRIDAILRGVEPGSGSLQITLDDENFKYPNYALADSHLFPLSVTEKSNSAKETSTEFGTYSKHHFDLSTLQSTSTEKDGVPDQANMTMVLYSTSVKLAHLSNIPHGFINQTSWKPQSSPPGHLLSLLRSQWDKNQFVPFVPMPPTAELDPSEAPWIDLVINNLDDGSHPFHLHGYDAYVLQTHAGFGWGSWNPFETSEPPGGPLEVQGAVRRDTFYVPKRGYTVLRFRASNPGIWMFHCHILWHQASGMACGLEVGAEQKI